MSDFFRINMPYGIARNENGEWMAFNREYLPLGFSRTPVDGKFDLTRSSEYPVHAKYKGVQETTLLALADSEDAISRDTEGNIKQVWFYNERTNPTNDPQGWDAYIAKIKAVSAFKTS